MITPKIRRTVSAVTLAVGLSGTFILAGCRHAPSTAAGSGTVAMPVEGITIDFQNEAQTYVDVYLAGDRREWRLGRVAPGARARLRVPESELARTSGFVRLVALTNSVHSSQAARDPRATITIAQPVTQLLEQRWVFRQTPLASPEILGVRASASEP